MNKKDKNRPFKIRKGIVDINQFVRRCYHNDITEQVIREYKDYIPYIFLVQKKQLSKDFLREIFSDIKIYDQDISSHQHLDQKFIEQWRDRLDWSLLSFKKTNLSEEFILKFSEKIDWKAIWKKKRKWSEQFWNYLKGKVKTEN